MSDIIDILTAKQAEEKIKEINRLGSVTILPHCKQRMKEKSYDTSDIDLILSKGRVNKPPEYNEKHGQWKCEVEGNAIEGDKATLVVAIVSHRELACITIMPK